MIAVMLCCNNDRGDHAGRIECVEFEDSERCRILLEGPSLTYRDKSDAGLIKIGRRIYRVLRPSSHWVGNMAWDAVVMDELEAFTLLRYLLERDYRPNDMTVDGPFAKVLRDAGIEP